jgi:hypothetical protein
VHPCRVGGVMKLKDIMEVGLTFAALSYYALVLRLRRLRCLHPRREENSEARSLTIVKMADPLTWAL